MKLILDRCEKFFGQWGVLVVVGCQCIDVGNFLIEPAFAGPDLPNAFKQFIEVVLAKYRLALLEPVVNPARIP